MQWLELKIPPPVLGALTAALMWAAARLTPELTIGIKGRNAVAVVLVCIGLAIDIAGLLAFRRARTTVNPLKPHASAALVVSGVYRYSRNPMYLGLLLVLSGWAAVLGNVAALLFLPLFVAYINRFQIAPEERALRTLFGQPYEQYLRSVRRWI